MYILLFVIILLVQKFIFICGIQIHAGRNIWISSRVYDSAVYMSKSPSTFTKNMALAIFGAQVLQESTVTGTVSNRIKGKRTEAPRPKLDEKRLLALKGFILFAFFNLIEHIF